MSSLPPKVQALYFTRCWGPTTGGARAASPFQTKEYQKMRLMIVVGSSITERESLFIAIFCIYFVQTVQNSRMNTSDTSVDAGLSEHMTICEAKLWWLIRISLWVCVHDRVGAHTPLPQGTDGSDGAWPFSGRQLSSRAMNEWHVPWSKVGWSVEHGDLMGYTWRYSGMYNNLIVKSCIRWTHSLGDGRITIKTGIIMANVRISKHGNHSIPCFDHGTCREVYDWIASVFFNHFFGSWDSVILSRNSSRAVMFLPSPCTPGVAESGHSGLHTGGRAFPSLCLQPRWDWGVPKSNVFPTDWGAKIWKKRGRDTLWYSNYGNWKSHINGGFHAKSILHGVLSIQPGLISRGYSYWTQNILPKRRGRCPAG